MSWYAKPEFCFDQMLQIRLGLEDGLDVSVYAKPEFNVRQMKKIRMDLMHIKNPLKNKLCDEIQALLK